jgi:hypothetical protein
MRIQSNTEFDQSHHDTPMRVLSRSAPTQSRLCVIDEHRNEHPGPFSRIFTSMNRCANVSFTVLYTSLRAAPLVCKSTSFDSIPTHCLPGFTPESGLRVADGRQR